MRCYKPGQELNFDLDHRTIDNIQREYQKDKILWSLGFSGGKDSSALLRLVYLALENLKSKPKPVTIIYCDTGVEIPVIRSLVQETLDSLSKEASQHEIPLITKIVYPKLQDRYFVKVIGRGYPPPTYKFRWCTDVLRIKPIQSVLKNVKGQSVLLLGIRKGESIERDRVLSNHGTMNQYYFRQSNNKRVIIYSPIVNYSVDDVWSTLIKNKRPLSIDSKRLQILYKTITSDKHADMYSSEVLAAKGRFGCWTCTVVRQDKAVKNLIAGGHVDLEPLLEFRNWLSGIRNNPTYRCKERRNGAKGLGPFTIEAREEILNKLLKAQSRTKWKLIEEEETDYIKKQWELDLELG